MKRLLAAIAVAAACSCAGVESRVDQLLKDAQVELRAGQIDRAQSLVDRGVALTQSVPDSPAAWRLRLVQAELQIARLNLSDAAVDLEKSIPEGREFDSLRARQHFLLAQLQLARGQLKQALSTLDAATALAGTDPELLADIEILGSQARLRLGQWDDAEQRLNTVARNSATRSDHYREALAINNLGMSRLIRSRFDEALQQFEAVLARQELEPTRAYSLALINTGICLARLGEYDRALSAQRRAVDILEHRGSKTDLMRALGEIGTTHYLRNEIPEAMPYLQRALTIATEAQLNADGWVWATNLALGYVQLEQWNAAAKYNDEAKRFKPNGARLVVNTATEARIAAGLGDNAAAERLFSEVLAKSADQPGMIWEAHEGLARVAVAAGRNGVAANHFDAALQTIEKTRSALLKADYRLSFLTRVIVFYRAYVDLLMATNQPDRALEIADSSRGRVLAERLGVAVPSRGAAATFKQRARESDQTFVFYWLAPSRSLAWVVSPQGIRSFTLAPSADIEALVTQYHNQLQNTSADPLSQVDGPGDRLYSRIIAPLAAALPANGKLVIVPDGALHRLNFETLPVREDGRSAHYLIEDVTIQIAPSLAMMTAAKSAPAARPLLLVGNPAPREPDFPALTYAAAEMDGVSKPFGDNATVLQSDQASPAAFRAAKPEQFSRIHFTSHALANTESPMDSAVILSGPDTAYKLYARDVAEMPLAADLVTVSACRSAGDRAYSGEGLVGFAWAFLRAGSRRVVAGLWDVDDRSTAALMSDFYGRLAASEAAPSALRNAKLQLLRERKMKPYYWAPLQMFTASP